MIPVSAARTWTVFLRCKLQQKILRGKAYLVVLLAGGQLVLGSRPLWDGKLVVRIDHRFPFAFQYGFSRLTHAVGGVLMCA